MRLKADRQTSNKITRACSIEIPTSSIKASPKQVQFLRSTSSQYSAMKWKFVRCLCEREWERRSSVLLLCACNANRWFSSRSRKAVHYDFLFGRSCDHTNYKHGIDPSGHEFVIRAAHHVSRILSQRKCERLAVESDVIGIFLWANDEQFGEYFSRSLMECFMDRIARGLMASCLGLVWWIVIKRNNQSLAWLEKIVRLPARYDSPRNGVFSFL